jgi:hypothetical protein
MLHSESVLLKLLDDQKEAISEEDSEQMHELNTKYSAQMEKINQLTRQKT